MTKLAIGILLIPLALAAADPMVSAADPSGIPNFHQVNDRIYRGAQPTADGFQALAKMGIKTVVDLRREEPQIREERRTVESLGMKFLSVPMEMGAPTEQQIARVMQELNSNAGPVFVHCHGGRDRTGTVIACYRKTHDAWDSQEALAEANLDGMRRDVKMRKYVQKFASPITEASAL
jgi:tyrosine-protein phosphatase SIW14